MSEEEIGHAPVVTARKLTERIQEFVAVNGIDFDFVEGERFSYPGPNGAGKTSTIKMIS